MCQLPYIIISLLFVANLFAQSPHGKDLKYDCSDCHSSVSWKEIPENIKFDHKKTDFKLSGQHKIISCVNCHQSLVFSNTKNDCSSCHKNIHQNSVLPVCSSCHTTQTWLITNINELHQQSRFPLIGIHVVQDCAQCHSKFSTLNFEVEGIECIDCHRNNFMATKNPDHIQAGFSTNCQQCHLINQISWGLSSFVHELFPLVGGHNIKDCFSCHQQRNFKGLSQDCYSCHKQNYEATTDPNHIQGKFSTDCTSCHNINGWGTTSFDHNATIFPLLGKHTTLSCNSCHSTGYTNLPLECYGCHKPDYEKAVSPSHVSNKFSTTCEQCHTSNGWIPASFDHKTTAFPLTGAHINLDCSLCHTNGYAGTPTDCYSCHKTKYDNTTNPNHITANFQTICEQCHTTNGWTPSTFDHNATTFPLTGKHTTVACNSCHTNSYTGTPTDCYACHKTNYDNTTNPNHIAASFPTVCDQCHTTNGWTPASFDHDNQYFPIYSGKHNGKWNTCSECHTTANNYAVFSCIDCHEHNKQDTDKDHNDVSNYVYASSSCYSCHPRGSE